MECERREAQAETTLQAAHVRRRTAMTMMRMAIIKIMMMIIIIIIKIMLEMMLETIH